MATITAAVLLIGGLIVIIILIIAVIYPEWFTHENKSMARVITKDREEKGIQEARQPEDLVKNRLYNVIGRKQ